MRGHHEHQRATIQRFALVGVHIPCERHATGEWRRRCARDERRRGARRDSFAVRGCRGRARTPTPGPARLRAGASPGAPGSRPRSSTRTPRAGARHPRPSRGRSSRRDRPAKRATRRAPGSRGESPRACARGDRGNRGPRLSRPGPRAPTGRAADGATVRRRRSCPRPSRSVATRADATPGSGAGRESCDRGSRGPARRRVRAGPSTMRKRA
jgi:hypothetical protein